MEKAARQIIIIEDDPVLRRGLRRIFSGENHRVFDFGDGKTARDQIRRCPPDLILCDYKLPDTNGLEILRWLKKNGKKTPFILITGYFKEEIADQARKNGAGEVLEKPLDLKLLKKVCRGFLGENIRARNATSF
ncbi:MAG: response regulator [Pyrinomonadaceae bacterium]